jgi:hypothetical protein
MKEILPKTVGWLLSVSVSLLMLGASPGDTPPIAPGTWIHAYSGDGFSLHYRIEECDGVSTVFLKARNESKAPIMAELSARVHGSAKGQEFEVGKVNPLVIALAKGQTLTGDCYSSNPNLRVNTKEHNPTHRFEATSFEINSITLK